MSFWLRAIVVVNYIKFMDKNELSARINDVDIISDVLQADYTTYRMLDLDSYWQNNKLDELKKISNAYTSSIQKEVDRRNAIINSDETNFLDCSKLRRDTMPVQDELQDALNQAELIERAIVDRENDGKDVE